MSGTDRVPYDTPISDDIFAIQDACLREAISRGVYTAPQAHARVE
jgi:hypothetical protein